MNPRLSFREVLGLAWWRLLLAMILVAASTLLPRSADARGPNRGGAAKHGKRFPHKSAGRCKSGNRWIVGCK